MAVIRGFHDPGYEHADISLPVCLLHLLGAVCIQLNLHICRTLQRGECCFPEAWLPSLPMGCHWLILGQKAPTVQAFAKKGVG